MAILQRFNSILEHKIEIDLERKINRNMALSILLVFALSIGFTGYFIGEKWFFLNKQNNYDYEFKQLESQLKTSKNSDDIKAQMAMTSYLGGNVAKAVAILTEVLTKSPSHDSALLNLGLIFTEQKRYHEAEILLNKYVKKNSGPESKLAFLYLGQDYLAIGQYRDAYNSFLQAQSRDQGNPVIYYYLGQTSEKLNDKRSAKNFYEKALGFNQNYFEAKNALENMLKRGTK